MIWTVTDSSSAVNIEIRDKNKRLNSKKLNSFLCISKLTNVWPKYYHVIQKHEKFINAHGQ